MSEHDALGDALERLEWDDDRAGRPANRLAAISRRTALTGGAAGLAALMLEACGGSGPSTPRPPTATAAPTTTSGTTSTTTSSGQSSAAAGVFGSNASFRFTVVNHARSSPLFTPTQYGAADACKLLGCAYQWTGSQTSNIPQLLNAINTAVSEKVNGIATTLIDPTAFNTAVDDALSAGIPVVAYNSDAPGNSRLAYIGQNLFASGQQLGEQIVSMLPHGGDIAIFASTPGQSNLQPRIEGVKSVLRGHHSIKHRIVSSGSTATEQLTTIESYINGHPTFHGFFAVDGGSTAAVGQSVQKYGLRSRGVVAGGFDLTQANEQLLQAGYLGFAIDQQAYLQGFLPILELYLYNVSDKLTGIADVDTGSKVVDRSTLKPYSTTVSRFEGTSSTPGVQPASSS